MNDKILNKTLEEWRKAYYSGELDTLLASVASNSAPSAEELAELDKYLQTLQNEHIGLSSAFGKYARKEVLPSVEDLMSIDPAKDEARKKWEIEMQAAYLDAKDIIAAANKAAKAGGAPVDKWLEWGLQLATLQCSLDQYRVWKDQIYHARLVDIMDSFDCTRAVAEERAKLTPEYRDYKNAVLFREMIEETIMLMKRWAGINEGR